MLNPIHPIATSADVAIRIAELPDSSYRALRVGSVRRVLCTSPDYLAARGLNPGNEMRFVRDGQPLTLKLQPMLSVSDNDSAAGAAMAGLGITRLLNYQIAEPLRTGKLQIVLSEFESAAVPVHRK